MVGQSATWVGGSRSGAIHGSEVVDDEHCVKNGQEGIGVVVASDTSKAGAGRGATAKVPLRRESKLRNHVERGWTFGLNPRHSVTVPSQDLECEGAEKTKIHCVLLERSM